MEGNSESSRNNKNTEKLKKETVDAVNDVKNTFKDVDIKRDTVGTKGFVSQFFTSPLETIKLIIEENSEKFLKYAIIILVFWLLAVLITRLGTFYSHWIWNFNTFFGDIFKNTLDIIKALLEPLLTILVVSVILLIFNKNQKKKLTTIITAVTTAYIPVAISEVFNILNLISENANKLTNVFSGFCASITLLLTYFVAKEVLGIQKHSEFFKKFVLFEVIYYGVYFILTFLGIYIK